MTPKREQVPLPRCTACGGQTESLGKVPVRIGGAGGLQAFILGKWAERGEDLYPIDIARCRVCGHLELYDLDASLPTA